MDDDQLMDAARAAHAAWSASGRNTGSFEDEQGLWLEVARAAIAHAPADEQWPLKARVWTRTSQKPHQKILEITGVVDDVHITCRHAQNVELPDSEVPGLPELYGRDEIPGDVSPYARAIAERLGMDGLEREAGRLLHKIETAASLQRAGRVRETLLSDGESRARVEHAVATGSVAWLARELDTLQARIVEAQRLADPSGRVALVLHTDEEHWERHDGYAAYLQSYGISQRE